MNLYLISQDANSEYDTFDALVVCAKNEEEARNITPDKDNCFYAEYSDWCISPEYVSVEFLGVADINVRREVILASYNAG